MATNSNPDRDKKIKLFLKPCKSRKEVAAWIKHFLGLHLPDITVSRYADTNPLDVIWEVYRICVLRQNPANIKELLYVAGRGSGKTLGMAIAELMILLHDRRDVVHVGAIQNQADRCYNYVKNFLYNPRIKDIVMPTDLPEEQRILEKANMSKSLFNVYNDKLVMEVIPCTLKACLTIDNRLLIHDRGTIMASMVKIGDKLVSPIGPVEVLESKMLLKECMMVELDDGRIIKGTLDHKVWTNCGWVALKDLTYDHEILSYLPAN